MPTLNRIELIGRLGKDPETHLTTTGKKVCTFSIAVDRHRKNVEGEEDVFHKAIPGSLFLER